MRLPLLILLIAAVAGAQSASPRKDIPAIAKAASGAIVSIVMSGEDSKPVAQGSGFLVSKDGLIVTNYHVIAEGSSAVAKLPDGAIYVLEGVVASDKARDVAIVKATGKNFRKLLLGNSDRVEVGQEVVAIGNPLSLESTVSNGIVSGIRTAEQLGGKFLQVTAPISPGSSGGPLFNMTGEVIGITTLYLKGGENLNFAIPINDAKRLLVDPCVGVTPPPGLVCDKTAVQAWPNEAQPTETQAHEERPPESDTRPGSTPQMDSPAYQSYLELLKSGDMKLEAPYACFEDTSKSDAFMVIDAILLDKRTLNVVIENFTSGVSGEGGIFEGQLTPMSGGEFFGTLHTIISNANPSHETDIFEWGPDVLSMKAGFGKLLPGQVRLTYEFKMQRSTGRYTEHMVFAGAANDGFTINKTGKCIRIPNTQTPEEAYGALALNNSLPPNTKIAASGPSNVSRYHGTQPEGFESALMSDCDFHTFSWDIRTDIRVEQMSVARSRRCGTFSTNFRATLLKGPRPQGTPSCYCHSRTREREMPRQALAVRLDRWGDHSYASPRPPLPESRSICLSRLNA